MARKRGLTHEEILKELQRLDELDSGDSDDSSLHEDKEYIPPKEDTESSSSSDDKIETKQSSQECRKEIRIEESSKNYRKKNCISKLQSTENKVIYESDSDGNFLPDPSQPSTSKARERTLSHRRGRKLRKKTSISFPGPLSIGHEETAVDGTVWKVIAHSATNGRRATQNILRESQGPTSYAKRNINTDNVISAWRLIFSQKMVHHIKQCTEAEAHRKLGNDTWTVTLDELDAVFSIMYARGLYGAKNFPVNTLWSSVWGPAFFSQTMPRDRFKDILRFLRFDLKTERSERLKTDKFALASALWDSFIENSAACYKPGENLTVDEQLLPSKARCPFTQYISNKPDKFGIKFWLLVCVDSKYILNGFPYTGQDINRPADQAVNEHVVMRLTQGYLGKGRNITTDNYFTSVKLCEKLKVNKTSLVGTLRKDRKEVPPTAKIGKQELYSTTLFKKDNDITITSYQGKKKKHVLLLSSLHPDVAIDNNEKKTPETVQFYNQTKFGVDIVDQMVRMYTTKSGTRRWPMHVFYNVLDMSALNSWILYKEVTGKDKLSRRNFIMQLCEELRTSYTASRGVAESNVTPTYDIKDSSRMKRYKCKVKTSCKGNHTRNTCLECKKPVCGQCGFTEVRCTNCFKKK